VGLHQRQVLVDDDVALGPQGMADPPQPHLANVEDARGGPNDRLHPVDECRVDGVHEPGEDLPGGLAEHGEGGDGCDQADDRVGQAEPEGDPPAPMSTTRLVRPSVRACRPSAISAAEPIRRPTRIRYRATSSWPPNPITEAAATSAQVENAVHAAVEEVRTVRWAAHAAA